MSDNTNQNHPTSNNAFKILWFTGVLGLGVALPLYFTMTQSGTATWIINVQLWITERLSGEPKWFPVVTGVLTCVVHIFAILGIIKGASLVIGLFKK